MEKVIDYYDVLRVSYFATTEEIKEAYRTKAKETHPDSITGDAVLFKLVKEAYTTLSNEEKRKRYNDFLFNSTKVNSPVNNYKTAEKPPNNTVNKENVPPKQKAWKRGAFLSIALNVALLAVVVWGYFQYLDTQKLAAEVKIKLDSSKDALAEVEHELKAVNYEYGLLQTDFNEYKENVESTVAAVKADSYVEETISSEESQDTLTEETLGNNPNGAFTQGSTKEHVKKIMGTPSSLNKMPLGGETWWYGGTAYVNFDANGLVEGWTDYNGDVLKVQ